MHNKQVWKTKCNYLFVKIILLFSFIIPNASNSQTPYLGAANDFTLFTAIGSFTNTGVSTYYGNIGTDVGAFSGFPPGIVYGQIHVADSLSAVTAVDVNNAYNYLFTLPCGSTIGPNLGNAQVLTPDVYCIGSAATLNSSLILDGLGSSASVFVIKVDGMLSANNFSKIILTNGATHDNVYWQVNGALTLGDSTSFFGTVITNGAITLLSGSTLIGRGLAIQGAISVNASTISINPLVPLSINTMPFYCNTKSNSNSCNVIWENSDPESVERFVVYRAKNNLLFLPVYSLEICSPNNNNQNYLYLDENLNDGNYYYYLKTYYMDGQVKNSETDAIEINRLENVTFVYPNPAKDCINVINDLNENYNLFYIMDIQGNVVFKEELLENHTQMNGLKLKAGIYTCCIGNTERLLKCQKIMIEK